MAQKKKSPWSSIFLFHWWAEPEFPLLVKCPLFEQPLNMIQLQGGGRWRIFSMPKTCLQAQELCSGEFRVVAGKLFLFLLPRVVWSPGGALSHGCRRQFPNTLQPIPSCWVCKFCSVPHQVEIPEDGPSVSTGAAGRATSDINSCPLLQLADTMKMVLIKTC